MKALRIVILFGTLAVFLYFINTSILGAENAIENGTVAYFELDPIIPRSSIQGNSIVLYYVIEIDAQNIIIEDSDRGQLVVSLDENRVAHYQRRYTEGDTLADNEVAVNFYADYRAVRVGVDAFYFQEGQADAYNHAQYAEVRVLSDGNVMLVNLVDENFEVIIPE